MNQLAAPARQADPLMTAAALKDLKARYRKTKRWLDACAAYSSSGDGPANWDPALAPNIRTMPSKAHKYRMYEAASRLIAAAGIDHPRPMSMADLGALLARFGA